MNSFTGLVFGGKINFEPEVYFQIMHKTPFFKLELKVSCTITNKIAGCARFRLAALINNILDPQQ